MAEVEARTTYFIALGVECGEIIHLAPGRGELEAVYFLLLRYSRGSDYLICLRSRIIGKYRVRSPCAYYTAVLIG